MASRNRRASALICNMIWGLTLGVGAAVAAAPAVNLTVQVRIVPAEEGSGGGYSVSTRDATPPATEMQSLQVLNGTRGHFQVGRSVPIQWVKEAARSNFSQAASGAAPGATRNAGGVVQGVTWLHAGQDIVVTPHWSGGHAPVTLELDFETSALDGRAGEAIPALREQRSRTTLTLPLERWTTFASTGDASAPRAGVWSTSASSVPVPQWYQVRVLAP